MQKKDFLNFNVLKESLLNQSGYEDGEAFIFNLIHKKVYEEDFAGFYFRYDFKSEAPRRVDLSRQNASLKVFSNLEVALKSTGVSTIMSCNFSNIFHLFIRMHTNNCNMIKVIPVLRSTSQEIFRDFSIMCYYLIC